MARGTVRLINAVFYAHHGVMQEEHRLGGRYEVDVAMGVDIVRAAQSDALGDTVDYVGVYRLIQEVVTENRFYLIEKLAYLIAQGVTAGFAQVQDVEVTVRKLNPPVGGMSDRAEAVFSATRAELEAMDPRPASGEVDAFVALGSNQGDRALHLKHAVEALQQHAQVEVIAASPVYETAAHTLPGQERQPSFLNAVAQIRTPLPPERLLATLHEVEHAEGRTRTERWAARPLDLDLLLYGGLRHVSAVLTVPHPRLAERRFVLQPLADLAAERVVPGTDGQTVRDLLAACPDEGVLQKTSVHLLRS